MMSISFPLEISLISGKTDGETKELLKALQYLAKALSIMGGILAFINRKNLLVYAVCLLLSTSAIDLGIIDSQL